LHCYASSSSASAGTGGAAALRRAVSRGKLKDLKTGQERTIKLYPGARAALEAQVAHSGAQRDWVFPNPFTGDRYASEAKFNSSTSVGGVSWCARRQLS
jgi:integrase